LIAKLHVVSDPKDDKSWAQYMNLKFHHIVD
jgi:hypothetical protein